MLALHIIYGVITFINIVQILSTFEKKETKAGKSRHIPEKVFSLLCKPGIEYIDNNSDRPLKSISKYNPRLW